MTRLLHPSPHCPHASRAKFYPSSISYKNTSLSSTAQVSEGYYMLGATTTTAGSEAAERALNDTALMTTPTAEALCEPGHWCEAGLRYPCEAGSFGSGFGMTRSNCSGVCSPGFLCGNGSVSPEERPCGVRTDLGDQGFRTGISVSHASIFF